jgi:peptidyl-prolyl cis-trans isomerase C
MSTSYASTRRAAATAFARNAAAAVATAVTLANAHAQAPRNAPLISGPQLQITPADMQAATQSVPAASRNAVWARTDNVQRQAQDLYLRRVLAAEAERAALDKDPAVAAQLRLTRERILSDARLSQIDKSAEPEPPVLERYARELYIANPKRFEMAAQTRARHILVGHSPDGKARERAQELLTQIKGGTPFEKLAREQSSDFATATKGGDLGWFAEGTMVKPFEEAVAALKNPGDLSDVVETQFGFHVIQLEGRRPAGKQPFEEVRTELEREVRQRLHSEARAAYASRLLEGAKIDGEAIEAFSRQFRK